MSRVKGWTDRGESGTNGMLGWRGIEWWWFRLVWMAGCGDTLGFGCFVGEMVMFGIVGDPVGVRAWGRHQTTWNWMENVVGLELGGYLGDFGGLLEV